MRTDPTRMPDGSFAVDKEQLLISREVKAPYIPLIKIKDEKSKMNSLSLQYVADYLYSIEYTDWDYDTAMAYMREKYLPTVGACSSVRNGDMYGRTYDWLYDDCADFVVSTKATKGRHASVGVAGTMRELTNDFAKSGNYANAYNILPFMVVDGINDAGVVCNINVLPHGDKPATTGTNPDGKDILTLMLPRYILDYAGSADEAIELLGEVNIISPHSETFSDEIHVMVADADKTYIVEFINNEVVVIDQFAGNKPVMTNFYISGFDGNTSTAFYNAAQYDPATTTLTPHAMGVERYDILASNYSDGATKDGMIGLMELVRYTRAYDASESPFWYSEFLGDWGDKYGDLDIDSVESDFSGVKAAAIEAQAHRKRGDNIWQTVHSSVYDIANKKLYVNPQESGAQYEFRLHVIGEEESISESDIPVMSGITLKSSTPNSTKKFRITVDDSGSISAAEII